ncbi:hypothetical protein KGP26_29120 (plasmid) [Serratia sp. JSRIV002]|uniref:hypothetical protein n=1 Tax=Serratia sp. JSRIV002 TaxID=2831894 RepID=UPI001CBFEE28|nr:hypothetical protein [Serratia sp. JSRIV002]UAN54635.1 hypothetical protein KGP26_29120 [Serratia sp. JSRIV002]
MMIRIIFLGMLILYSIMSSAIAGPIINCVWDNTKFFPLTTRGFKEVIDAAITSHTEEYNCNSDGQCLKRIYYTVPNQTFTVTASNSVTCINNGDSAGDIKYQFYRILSQTPHNYKGLTMFVPGGGAWLTLDGRPAGISIWQDGTLAPCEKNCTNIRTGSPQYRKIFSLTFTASPILTRSYDYNSLRWDAPDYIGNWSVDSRSPVTWATIPVCISNQNNSTCGQYLGGMGSGGNLVPPPPPTPQCTLKITTPDIVQFQPISSDDLSRNRVRMEDFTLTATKGPVQSEVCIGNVYNLPGEIKTEGGYSISSTFWGINHSSGISQGIGLKIYDLDEGNYMQFNHRYSNFIKNIRTISETKRFRAEIAASTNDLKKIKSGEYSQVLTFEVRIP